MQIVPIQNLAEFEDNAKLGDDENAGIRQTVRAIIHEIIDDGDRKLIELTNQLDNNKFKIEDIRVSEAEIDEAYENTDKDIIKALELSADRVQRYYEKQLPKDVVYEDRAGVKLGWRYTPLDSVGLYVPGGTAAYPSSVIMNAIPAIVAGVRRLAVTTPAPGGKISQEVLAACKICGISEIYKVGGAQAVAALAYGTKTIQPVCKIVGPGNAYVAEAKRQVFGQVGIDMIAGPSEILIIADKDNNPSWLAADLLSQAEHDPSARSIMITDNEDLADAVKKAVEEILPELEREEIARKSIEDFGVIYLVDSMDLGIEIANEIAAEHLELAVDNPEKMMKKITNAGAIFLGRYTPEAIGDYIAGPSHVLPTSGSAKFSNGLSVFDFLKRQSIIGCSRKSFRRVATETETLAIAEGLTAHALSARIRNED